MRSRLWRSARVRGATAGSCLVGAAIVAAGLATCRAGGVGSGSGQALW